MKFWVLAKGDALEEQLLVSADSTEDLQRHLEELLHIAIRQMSVTDFQSQVVEKLSSGSDIITVNIRTRAPSVAAGSSGPNAALEGSMTASAGSMAAVFGGCATSDGASGPRSVLDTEGGSAMESSSHNVGAGLVRTNSASGSFSTGTASGQPTSAGQGVGERSTAAPAPASAPQPSARRGSASELFNTDILLPIERICVPRDTLLMLLSATFRGKFHDAVKGCFVRVRGASSLATTASGYAIVQIVSLASNSQIGLDLVHVVEVRHLDVVSNSPPTTDEVRVWAKHMLHAGRSMVTTAFIEGKRSDIDEACRDAQSFRISPQPPAEVSEHGGGGASRNVSYGGTFAPLQEPLGKGDDAPPDVVLDDAPTGMSKLRRRQTAFLHPQNFLVAVPSNGSGGEGLVDVSPIKAGASTSSTGNSPTLGTSPTHASRVQQMINAGAAGTGGGSQATPLQADSEVVPPPLSRTNSSSSIKSLIKQRLDSISQAMSQSTSVAPPTAPPPPLDVPSAPTTLPPPRGSGWPPEAQSATNVVNLNDTLLNGWMTTHVVEDGTFRYDLFATRHSNPKAKRVRLSDFSGCCMSMNVSEADGPPPPTSSSSGGSSDGPTAAVGERFVVASDRDVTAKGFIVHCPPQLFRGAFVTLASPASDLWDTGGDKTQDSPATSPHRHRLELRTYAPPTSAAHAPAGDATKHSHRLQPNAPHLQQYPLNGYEFVVLCGRDIYGLYNPPWKCQLPVPSWGAPLSSPMVVLRPQLLFFGDLLHAFYLVALQRTTTAAGTPLPPKVPSSEVSSVEEAVVVYGLAHATCSDARLAQWKLLTEDVPILEGSSITPLFHVSVAPAGDALVLFWCDISSTAAIHCPLSSEVRPSPHGGGGSSVQRFRSPSMSRFDLDASTPDTAMSGGRSPVPTPPLFAHGEAIGAASQPLPLPSGSHATPRRSLVADRPSFSTRLMLNMDDQHRSGAWVPHDVKVPLLAAASLLSTDDRKGGGILEELTRDPFAIRSMSLVRCPPSSDASNVFAMLVGEDKHHRAAVVFLPACAS